MKFVSNGSLSSVMSDPELSIEAKLVYSRLFACHDDARVFSVTPADAFSMACQLFEFAVNQPTIVADGFSELLREEVIREESEV